MPRVSTTTSSIPILFAGTTFVVGGAERILYHLIRGLNREPFQIELLALRELGAIGEEIRDLGIPTHSGLTGSTRIDAALPFKLARLIRSRRFEAIYFLDHAHAVFYGTIASWGSRVRARVMPVHTTGQWGGKPSLKTPVRLVRPWLRRIIAIAEAQRLYLMQKEGVPRNQLEVIPNGIPIRSPSAAEKVHHRAEARRIIGVEDETPVIGITAVLRPEKNHELLLRALAMLRHRLPTVELWIVGDGPRRQFLQDEADKLGVTKAARFLGHREDARDLMAGFDVAVLSSHPSVETLPLSLLEAMDAGVPVVATRVGALAEMVEDGESGWLVPIDDATAMSDALERVLVDREARLRMGERGQQIAGERYSVDQMVESTSELLLRLLGYE